MAAPNAKPTSTPEWASTASTVTPWLAATAYTAGTLKTNGGNVYEVVTAGTSAGSGGPAGTGQAIADNTITWRYLGKAGTAGGTTEPSSGRKQTGWLAGEAPPHGFFNWWQKLTWQWTRFLDTFNQYLQIWQNAAVFEGPPAWAPSTAYAVGEYILNSGKVYVCTVAGTSAGSGGPTGMGTGITDGGVTWDYAQLPFDVEVPARFRGDMTVDGDAAAANISSAGTIAADTFNATSLVTTVDLTASGTATVDSLASTSGIIVNTTGSGTALSLESNDTGGGVATLHVANTAVSGSAIGIYAQSMVGVAVLATSAERQSIDVINLSATNGGIRLSPRPGAEPTDPDDGDIWLSSTGQLRIRIAGVTKTVTLT